MTESPGNETAPVQTRQQQSHPPRWRTPLLAVHLISAVGLLGAVAVVAALGISGMRGAAPVTIYPAMHLIETWLVAPLALTALGTGVLLALGLGCGLLRYWWVTIKLAITTTMTLLVFLLLEPRLATAADAALGQTAEPLTDAMKTRLAIVPILVAGLLIANVCLGLYKPKTNFSSGTPQTRATKR